MRPAIAAFQASASESAPSVAEIAVCSSVTNVTGRAPVWSTSARFFASLMSPIPVIWAPFVPPIPFGYCSKSIDGARLDLAVEHDREALDVVLRVAAAAGEVEQRLPRSAMLFVISANLSPPLSVNCIVTIGSPVVVSKSWRVPESLRSSPRISGTVVTLPSEFLNSPLRIR